MNDAKRETPSVESGRADAGSALIARNAAHGCAAGGECRPAFHGTPARSGRRCERDVTL
jgi:hypothetical protein